MAKRSTEVVEGAVEDIIITLPQKMIITAGKDRAVRFIPYKENFVTPVEKNTSLTLVATTVGQYLYYLKQGFVKATDAQEGTIDIVVPAKITIKNNTSKVQNFIPYRENFQQELLPGQACSFDVKVASQVLYYIAQDTTGYGVEGGLDVDFVKIDSTKTEEPASITE